MHYLYPHAKILLFTKPAYAGKCKTRLIPSLGKAGAAQLQEKLLSKIISDLIGFKLCPFEIWQSEASDYFMQFESEHNLKVRTQAGHDLGERMSAGLSASLSSSDCVIIIGSDCVDYTKSYLASAIEFLLHREVVIGPAYDGGYVLIGMSKFYPQIFENIEWGTPQVLKTSLRKLGKDKISYSVLATLHDIDRPEDLARLTKKHPNWL